MTAATLPFEDQHLATTTYSWGGQTAHAEHVALVDAATGVAVAVSGAGAVAVEVQATPVTPSPQTASHGAVAVGAAATRLDAGAPTGRRALSIANADAVVTLYVGFDATVTVADGFPIPPGQSIDLDLTDAQAVYGIAASTVSARMIQTAAT